MPNDLPRALLGVVVSFDEYSHFGVYIELILHWKRKIILTTGGFGQIRFSDTLAYGLQRWGGVYRRIAGISETHHVIAMPATGMMGDEYDEADYANMSGTGESDNEDDARSDITGVAEEDRVDHLEAGVDFGAG